MRSRTESSQDVTEAVLWLVSPRARYVTGVAIPVDAGHLILTPYNLAPTR